MVELSWCLYFKWLKWKYLAKWTNYSYSGRLYQCSFCRAKMWRKGGWRLWEVIEEQWNHHTQWDAFWCTSNLCEVEYYWQKPDLQSSAWQALNYSWMISWIAQSLMRDQLYSFSMFTTTNTVVSLTRRPSDHGRMIQGFTKVYPLFTILQANSQISVLFSVLFQIIFICMCTTCSS